MLYLFVELYHDYSDNQNIQNRIPTEIEVMECDRIINLPTITNLPYKCVSLVLKDPNLLNATKM